MKWRYLTRRIDGEHRIVGFKKQSRTKPPSRPMDIPVPPDFELFDDHNRSLYVLTKDGPEYRGVPEEILKAAEQERVNNEARAALAADDWQVIRAMERWMVEHNELPTEFGQEREALRQAVDDSRA